MSKTLEGIDLTMPPEEKEEEQEEKEEVKQEKTMLDYLAEYEDAPDQVRLEQWKQQYGEVMCSGLSETELYIFRPITRSEFINLQKHLANMKDPSNFEVEKIIVDTCLLWASPQGLASLDSKAGTFSTLHEQILQASNFINAAYVSQFVVKL